MQQKDSDGNNLFLLSDIRYDEEFNHRGHIDLPSIISMAKDIEQKGQLQPISIREIKDPEYKYQVTDGHRRYKAIEYLNRTQIKADITNFKNEDEAKTASAVANLHKEDLTFYQEARAIAHLYSKGLRREEIARKVNKSPGWVQIRCMILDLPTNVQNVIAEGHVTQEDIRYLYFNVEPSNQFEHICKVNERRANKRPVRQKKKQSRNSKRKRSANEILVMMDHIRMHQLQFDDSEDINAGNLITEQGDSFFTEIGAWCAGYISTFDFYLRFQTFCKLFNYKYVIPEN